MDLSQIASEIASVKRNGKLNLDQRKVISFLFQDDLKFNRKFLEFHPNGIRFRGKLRDGRSTSSTFYSIGGRFVIKKERKNTSKKMDAFRQFPFPIEKASELLDYCRSEEKSVSDIVLENERSLRNEKEIKTGFEKIWTTMLESMCEGCHTKGTLPRGLNVKRRGFEIHQRLIGDAVYYGIEEWVTAIRKTDVKFRQILKWVSCFAFSVNEVNTSLGRVVTAPTDGSAGTIPTVMMDYMVIENHDAILKELKKFMLVAGEIGSLFKKGATISAAMGGCQAFGKLIAHHFPKYLRHPKICWSAHLMEVLANDTA